MSTDLKSLSPDEARHQAACSALPIAAHGYVPPAPPKPEIRLWDRVRLPDGREGVVTIKDENPGGRFAMLAADSGRTLLRDGGAAWFSEAELILVSRPTWAPVEQSDR